MNKKFTMIVSDDKQSVRFVCDDWTEIEVKEIIKGTLQVSAKPLGGPDCLRVVPQASNVIRIFAEKSKDCDTTY